MIIQWFPGHMHKAQKEMRKLLPRIDVVIEVLDARVPFSSRNPLIETIRADKPHIKLLNKADLADPQKTRVWADELSKQFELVLSLNARNYKEAAALPDQCIELLARTKPDKKVRELNALITGIPNVGKSTLINTIMGRAVAKTGNEPAITKGHHKIRVNDEFVLHDTPGILWPNLGHPNIGYRLATLGSIRETAIDYADVGFFAAAFMLQEYPELLQRRYAEPAADALGSMASGNNTGLDSMLSSAELVFLESFARHRGAIQRGNRVDLDQASRLFLNELRQGVLGQITLELPQNEVIERQQLAEMAASELTPESGKKKRKK